MDKIQKLQSIEKETDLSYSKNIITFTKKWHITSNIVSIMWIMHTCQADLWYRLFTISLFTCEKSFGKMGLTMMVTPLDFLLPFFLLFLLVCLFAFAIVFFFALLVW